MNFKLFFPAGYSISDILDDNIDVDVILENENVYVITLFTLDNIKKLMNSSTDSYFWASDMLVIKDLSPQTIEKAVSEIVADQTLTLESIGSYIGKINEVFSYKNKLLTFNSIPHFGTVTDDW